MHGLVIKVRRYRLVEAKVDAIGDESISRLSVTFLFVGNEVETNFFETFGECYSTLSVYSLSFFI